MEYGGEERRYGCKTAECGSDHAASFHPFHSTHNCTAGCKAVGMTAGRLGYTMGNIVFCGDVVIYWRAERVWV